MAHKVVQVYDEVRGQKAIFIDGKHFWVEGDADSTVVEDLCNALGADYTFVDVPDDWFEKHDYPEELPDDIVEYMKETM